MSFAAGPTLIQRWDIASRIRGGLTLSHFECERHERARSTCTPETGHAVCMFWFVLAISCSQNCAQPAWWLSWRLVEQVLFQTGLIEKWLSDSGRLTNFSNDRPFISPIFLYLFFPTMLHHVKLKKITNAVPRSPNYYCAVRSAWILQSVT